MKMRRLALIEIQNRKFYISAVLDFLDSLVSKHPNVDFSRYNRLRYVVGEILTNRIENAYPNSTGTLEVEFSLSDDCFEASVKDKGVPAWNDFSYNETPDIYDSNSLRNYILDLWMDDIGMEKLGKDGQRIYVRMNILHPLEFKAPEPYAETEVLDTNISIKPVETEEDAIEAIRCIYSEYGYSYSYEKLYYVDSFMKMVKNKKLMSFLAVNEHGQTAGHFALSFSDTFKNMPEISSVVTRKEFRGLGLFAKFMDYCMELGKQHGFRAFMGQPVAFHPMSQKAFLKSDFTATSVLLSYIASDVESEYNKEKKRLDLFASVKILDESAQSIIYPPTEIHSFIDKIYKKLGWKYTICTDLELHDNTEMKIENNNSLKSTKVVINGVSDDIAKLLADIVKDSIRRKHEMIEMLISLNDKSCAYCYEMAKKCGFVLSGLIPGSENCDYLVMQMLIGTDCHYEHLVTVGDFEELKNDIITLNN
ncbi:MAG: ATP-binding protein [Clostridia bacterium]|nr:ATP-binding protein [Clostridia bacterium]